MKKVLVKTLESSFLSQEKDLQKIIEKLFLESKPFSDELKKLLLVTNKDCLTNPQYNKDVAEVSVADLVKSGYIKDKPVLTVDEKIKSYIIITFTNFKPNDTNPAFRDCIINIDIICHSSVWSLDNFAIRPMKIMGYIDGILNKSKLSGIGTLSFLTADLLGLNEEFNGYSITFAATHNALPSNGDDRSIEVLPFD